MISNQIKDVMDQVAVAVNDSDLTDHERELMGYALRNLGLAHSLVSTANALRLADLVNGQEPIRGRWDEMRGN